MTAKNLILQGIAYDEKSSFLRGPAEAPPLIRSIMNNGSTNNFTEEGVDLDNYNLIDKGDFSISNYFEIESITSRNFDQKSLFMTLGGDHSITYPIFKAISKKNSAIDILHIDAHGDIYHEFEGDKFSHACPFARIMEEGLAENLVQVGIRTLTTHQREQVAKFNIDCREVKDHFIDDLKRFTNPLYISLDMDAFDPAYAPGVSHHEPGGLNTRQVLDMIQQIETPIIAADIVEYNPRRDINEVTGALAAKMLKEIWGKMIENS